MDNDLPAVGYGLNWRRIGYARRLLARRRSICPAKRMALIEASLIVRANGGVSK